MPSAWTVTLTSRSDATLMPSQLHAFVSEWVEHAANPPRFSASADPFARGFVIVRITVLADCLADRLAVLSWSTPRPASSRSMATDWVVTSVIRHADLPWSSLRDDTGPLRADWRLTFVTPTLLSRRSASDELRPQAILHGAADRWRVLSPETCPVPRGAPMPAVSVSDMSTAVVQRTSKHEVISGRVGDCTVHLGSPGVREGVALLRFAELAGAGRYVTRGMGVVRLSPAESASPPTRYRR